MTSDRLPQEDYEVIDAATCEPGPRRARLSGGSLFDDFVFCCVGPFRDVTLEQLEVRTAAVRLGSGSGSGSAPAPARLRLRDSFVG